MPDTGLLISRGKKVKFCEIFRDKFTVKSAFFCGIFAEIFEVNFSEKQSI